MPGSEGRDPDDVNVLFDGFLGDFFGVANRAPAFTSKPRSAKAEANHLLAAVMPSWPILATRRRGRFFLRPR